MAPTRPARSLRESNRSPREGSTSQRVKPVVPLTRAEAAGKRVFISDLDGQDRLVDASRKDEISEKIVLNSVQETMETVLVILEFGGTREDVLNAIRSLITIMDELGDKELWESIGGLCKMAKNKRVEDDVRTEGLELIRVIHGRIVLHEKEFLDAVAKSQGLPAVERAAMAAEHDGPDIREQEMANALMELFNCDNPAIAKVAGEVIPQIDSLPLRELYSAAVFLDVHAEKVTANLSIAQSEAEFIASAEEVEEIALKLDLDALWKVMDALCGLAEKRETTLEVRVCAFKSMPLLYKRIAAKIAEENTQEICFSEARMAKVIVNTSLGTEGEEPALVEAATQAMDNIPSPIVQNMLLNCGFIGESKDRDEMAHQIEELDNIDTTLRDTSIDVKLAMFLYAMED